MQRYFLLFIAFLSSLAVAAQQKNGECSPTIAIEVKICYSRISDSSCAPCNHCQGGLVAQNKDFTIISYKVRAEGEGFDGMEERNNTGAAFNEARTIIAKARKGSIVEFSCIKAKYKTGDVIYILQPFTIGLP